MAFGVSQDYEEIRQRCMAPNGWTDAQIDYILERETKAFLVPKVVKARCELLIATDDQALVDGTSSYAVHTNAVANGLRACWRLDTSSKAHPLDELAPDRIPEIEASTARGTPYLYYFEAGNVIVYPTPTSSQGTLRMKYHVRPTLLSTLPYEFAAPAHCRAAAIIAKSVGDFQFAKALEAEAEAKEDELIALLSPRNKGASKTMVNDVWG